MDEIQAVGNASKEDWNQGQQHTFGSRKVQSNNNEPRCAQDDWHVTKMPQRSNQNETMAQEVKESRDNYDCHLSCEGSPIIKIGQASQMNC